MAINLHAFESIKEQYDIDTLREIAEHGCVSGVANNHIYYTETVKFFDEHEDEIIEHLADYYGGEYSEEVWYNNSNHINGYKNEIVWSFIESVAQQLVDEYEDITCEEMNDTFDDILSLEAPKLKELSETEWGKNHLKFVTL